MLEFAILGLGAGAVYALVGQGIVLIFRGSGVLNLAHGAYAMFGAYLFAILREQHAWAAVPAILVAVVAVAAIGLITDRLVLAKLRRASPLARLIATLGVFLILFSVAVILWSDLLPLIGPIFDGEPVTIANAIVPVDRLWTLGAAVVVTVALTAIWRFTRVGWITEAVSESELAAASLGWSPQVVSSATWTAGAALAGLAGALIAPLTQLSIPTLSLLIIPGLAAALIGSFRSFPLTLAGGLIVGIVQSEAGKYINAVGVTDAAPFALLVVVLAIRGSGLPLRGHIFDRLPSVGSGRIRPRVVVLSTACGLLVCGLLSQNWQSAVASTFAVALILLSLVVVVGYTGQLSLAQYALAGIGAMIAAQLVANSGWAFAPAAAVGMVGAMIVGLAFALPALRTRGVNLAVMTLGLGVAVQALIFNNARYTGSISGIRVGAQSLFGWDIGVVDHPGRYAALSVVLFVLCALAVANLRRGRSGRRLLAVRANERAAAASGINVFAAKLHAFGIAGALAGLGGILVAFQASTVTFGLFSPLSSVSAVAQAVIGGVGFVVGPLVGAQLSSGSWGSLVGQHWSKVAVYLPLIGGVALLVTLISAQNGVVERVGTALRRLRRGTGVVHNAERDIPAAKPNRVTPRALTVAGVSVRYGNVLAVDGVSLEVQPGQVVGLIGPNGAGKTSLMDAITGFTSCSGHVEIDGQDIGRWPAHRRARGGLVRSFQGLELFADMTVLENLQAASDDRDLTCLVTDLVRPGSAHLPPAAVAAIHEFDLVNVLNLRPDDLSYGQRRLVAIARAVASEPSILLLDEPAAGLDSAQSREFAHLVRGLAENWGMAILVIEHDMDFVMGLCDTIVVMNFGYTIACGTPSEIRADPTAVAAYLGEQPEHESARPGDAPTLALS